MTYRSRVRRSNFDDVRQTSTPFNRRFTGAFEYRAPLPAIPPLPAAQVVQRQITDDLEALLAAIPPVWFRLMHARIELGCASRTTSLQEAHRDA